MASSLTHLSQLSMVSLPVLGEWKRAETMPGGLGTRPQEHTQHCLGVVWVPGVDTQRTGQNEERREEGMEDGLRRARLGCLGVASRAI